MALFYAQSCYFSGIRNWTFFIFDIFMLFYKEQHLPLTPVMQRDKISTRYVTTINEINLPFRMLDKIN